MWPKKERDKEVWRPSSKGGEALQVRILPVAPSQGRSTFSGRLGLRCVPVLGDEITGKSRGIGPLLPVSPRLVDEKEEVHGYPSHLQLVLSLPVLGEKGKGLGSSELDCWCGPCRRALKGHFSKGGSDDD